MDHIPRQVVQGVQALLYPDGPYVEVAERLRILHKLGTDFRLQQADTVLIRNRWIYRVVVMIDGQQYLGDAEIHFGAPKTMPDGTNPVTCGQTSAIGNALTFAGYGDLRLLLQRLQRQADEAKELYPSREPFGEVEGIRIVWLDETPYVPVAERLYHLHQQGHHFSMDRGEVIRVQGVWVYRVWVRVDERSYIGDAEVHFSAPETAPERRFPVSTAQTSAVGTALALAGFGDVRSLLERMGKDTEHVLWVSSLASAEAVSQAQRQRQAHANEVQAVQTPVTQDDSRMTTHQQERVRELSARLAEPEPIMDDWTEAEADTYIEALRLQMDDVLSTAEEAFSSNGAGTPLQEASLVSYTEIGDLKRAWMHTYQPVGSSAVMRRGWETFKQQQCQEPVNDDRMSRAQYLVLRAAIEHPQQTRQTSPSSSRARRQATK